KVSVTKVEVLCEITRNRINASIDDAKIVSDKEKSALPAAPAAATPAPAVQPEQTLPPKEKSKPLEDAAAGGSPTTPAAPGTPSPMLPGPMGQLPTFKPGDTIKVKVRLQPYRTEAVWRQFAVKVPDNFPSGSTMLVVHGGGDL